MASFDVVCEVDLQEVDNAVNQATKEILTRFDFRGGKSNLEFDKAQKLIKLTAADELKLRAMHVILETKIAKRGLDCRCLDYKEERPASGQILVQTVNIKTGLDKDQARKIVKAIKDSQLKVTAQIQDEQVRVTGKSIDELQGVIAMLKTSDLGLPLQFVNMKR